MTQSTKTLLIPNSIQNIQFKNLHKLSFIQPLLIMSKALVRELDLKMQQVREYGLIAHGYHNENFQYPIHVRRSHDGEKLSRKIANISDSTILTPSSHENRTKVKGKDITQRHYLANEHHCRTLFVPPNKTINDINPTLNNSHRQLSLSSINSSPILSSDRPHSVTSMSISTTDQQQRTSLSDSAQSLINPSPSMKTITQRFFSKLFHHPSKS